VRALRLEYQVYPGAAKRVMERLVAQLRIAAVHQQLGDRRSFAVHFVSESLIEAGAMPTDASQLETVLGDSPEPEIA
jgi:hypothetical protein